MAMENGKCWLVVALNIVIGVLLLPPWLSVSGPAGSVTTNAFGHLDGTLESLHTFYRPSDEIISVNGLFGDLVLVTVILTVLGTALYWMGSGLISVAVPTIANAVFIAANLLYVGSKASGLRNMTFFGFDPGSGATFQSHPAGIDLTYQALLCAVAFSIMAAIVLSMPDRAFAATEGESTDASPANDQATRSPALDGRKPRHTRRTNRQHLVSRLTESHHHLDHYRQAQRERPVSARPTIRTAAVASHPWSADRTHRHTEDQPARVKQPVGR